MKLFSYDDMCLVPKYSELESRDDGDTSVNLFGEIFQLPIVPANMLDVISWDIARLLNNNEYFYIMHRFEDANREIPEHFTECLSLSLGVKGEDQEFLDNLAAVPRYITLDVAHAHHKNVVWMMKFLQNRYSSLQSIFRPKVIVGNVATAEGYKFLCDFGADMVKVGIGGGSICTTRFQTGFHIPTAYAVWDCATNGDRDIPIIADGGANHFGDVAKALTLGAKMVMSGSWFASCLDSPAKIQNGKKLYRGSTSYEAKGQRKHIEGRTLELEEGTTYLERLEEIRQAICSSISYGGGKDLSCFNHVEWKLL
jgi:GMP reductase